MGASHSNGADTVENDETTDPRGSSVRPHAEGEIYVSVGDLVAGKYRVERVLGRGGMAFVVSAKHVELEECFALKFLNREFVRQKQVIERFSREAKAACKIRSEHVARVYDVGTHDGAPFLVMEQLEGEDLGTVLARDGALPVDSAVEYTMQACQALAAAHSHGIVHRDIKPENLFLVEHDGLPRIKLLDFGISKIGLTGGERGSRLTGQLRLGTPQYMSPEQIRSTASVDARSDLWSLGVVLYELLTGMEAFKADTVTGLCALVLERDPRPLRELRPDVPPELADVVARCMQKDAARRYANVVELAVALLPFAPMRAQDAAERSSSIMHAARRAQGRDRVSRVRPSSDAPASWRPSVELDLSLEDAPPPSAPPSRSLQPSVSDAAAPRAREQPARRWGAIALVAGGFAVVTALGLVTYSVRVRSGERAAAAGAAATAVMPEETRLYPAASAPTVTIPTVSVVDDAHPSGDPAGAKSSAPRKSPPLHPPPPPRSSATHPSPSMRSAPTTPSAAPEAPPPAPSTPATAVELGY